MDLSSHDQPEFVVNVLLNDIELQNRGVNRPKNLFIMRTAFGDRRPTLFCVKKWLSRDLNVFWENVNINFVNIFTGLEFKLFFEVRHENNLHKKNELKYLTINDKDINKIITAFLNENSECKAIK